MAQTRGIVQSVQRAWRLMQQTGLFDASRGLYTEAWQRNVREAVRELREAARALVRGDNLDAYGELPENLRLELWRAILAARAPATGEFIISRLGGRYRAMSDDVRAADRAMASRANGFPVSVLHAMTARILGASPDRATVVEQEAARQGDPPPRDITQPEAELYTRIVSRAITRSNAEANSHRNAGDAALGAFGQSLLPGATPDAWLQNRAEGDGLGLMFGERAQSAGLVLSMFRAVRDGVDAHQRHTDAEYRLQHWIRQGCLAESNNDSRQAEQLFRQLKNIKDRMDAWLRWLNRHPDHPSYVPPHGTIEAAPTASLDASRAGAGNRTGPVRGSVRGPFEPGPNGLA